MKKLSQARKLELLTEHYGETVRVGKRAEYPVLFIGETAITEGSSEVKQRIDQLLHENGLDYDE